MAADYFIHCGSLPGYYSLVREKRLKPKGSVTMKKLFLILLSFFLLAFPSVTMADTTPNTTTVPVQRIYGQDRYQTATAIADQLAQKWGIDYSKGQQFQAVVLASGNNWPDAICGAPLAKLNNAPILLLDTTPESAGSQTTWSYIQAHVAKTGKVFILGGKGVVPQLFTDHLVSMGFASADIEQIGGKDRDETSYLIAKEVNKLGSDGDALLVTDQTFYDALTVSGFAALAGCPILLASPSGFSTQAAYQYATSTGVWPIGDIVSSAHTILPNANIYRPVNGGGEYGTNRAFVEEQGYTTSVIYLATGDDYPDALAGAVLAGADPIPTTASRLNLMQLVLTAHNALPSDTSAILNEITGRDKTPTTMGTQHLPPICLNPQLVVFGGPGAISDSVVNQVVQIMSGPGMWNA